MGKLESLERISEQVHGEIRTVKQKVAVNEDRGKTGKSS